MSIFTHSKGIPTINSEESLAVQRTAHALRGASFFTMTVTAFYGILFVGANLLSLLLTGDILVPDLSTKAGLAYAGQLPTTTIIGFLADGFSHVTFFVTFVAVFALLRRRWPVQATFIVIGAAWQLFAGLTKVLTSVYIATSLGAAYLAAPLAGRAAFLPVGLLAEGLQQGLQDMDTYGVMAVWLVMAFLPKATGMPRLVRWFGVGMSIVILVPGGFVLAMVLLPVWAIALGLWLKGQAAGMPSAASTITVATAPS